MGGRMGHLRSSPRLRTPPGIKPGHCHGLLSKKYYPLLAWLSDLRAMVYSLREVPC